MNCSCDDKTNGKFCSKCGEPRTMTPVLWLLRNCRAQQTRYRTLAAKPFTLQKRVEEGSVELAGATKKWTRDWIRRARKAYPRTREYFAYLSGVWKDRGDALSALIEAGEKTKGLEHD